MQHPTIDVHQLSKQFNRATVVEPISFQVNKGTILGFLGPNGAGKSTTMKMLTGCLQPSQGEVWINNHNLLRHPQKAKRSIGYLPENNPMYLDMYVHEYLEFMGHIRGLSKQQCTTNKKTLIDRCGITPMQHQPLRTLSKGYRQRVGLAQALIHDPEVLILDEPTTGLDPNQLQEIRTLIKEVSQEKAVILSTHIMQEVEALCDEVLIIDHGQQKAHNTLAQLTAADSNQILLEFTNPIHAPLLSTLPGVLKVKSHSDRKFLMTIETGKHIQTAFFDLAKTQKWTVHTFQPQKPSLDKVFQTLTQADHTASTQ